MKNIKCRIEKDDIASNGHVVIDGSLPLFHIPDFIMDNHKIDEDSEAILTPENKFLYEVVEDIYEDENIVGTDIKRSSPTSTKKTMEEGIFIGSVKSSSTDVIGSIYYLERLNRTILISSPDYTDLAFSPIIAQNFTGKFIGTLLKNYESSGRSPVRTDEEVYEGKVNPLSDMKIIKLNLPGVDADLITNSRLPLVDDVFLYRHVSVVTFLEIPISIFDDPLLPLYTISPDIGNRFVVKTLGKGAPDKVYLPIIL